MERQQQVGGMAHASVGLVRNPPRTTAVAAVRLPDTVPMHVRNSHGSSTSALAKWRLVELWVRLLWKVPDAS